MEVDNCSASDIPNCSWSQRTWLGEQTKEVAGDPFKRIAECVGWQKDYRKQLGGPLPKKNDARFPLPRIHRITDRRIWGGGEEVRRGSNRLSNWKSGLNNHWERRQSDPRARSQSKLPVVSFECGGEFVGKSKKNLGRSQEATVKP